MLPFKWKFLNDNHRVSKKLRFFYFWSKTEKKPCKTTRICVRNYSLLVMARKRSFLTSSAGLFLEDSYTLLATFCECSHSVHLSLSPDLKLYLQDAFGSSMWVLQISVKVKVWQLRLLSLQHITCFSVDKDSCVQAVSSLYALALVGFELFLFILTLIPLQSITEAHVYFPLLWLLTWMLKNIQFLFIYF